MLLSIVLIGIIQFAGCTKNNNEKEIKSLIVANDAVMKTDAIIENQVKGLFSMIRVSHMITPGKTKDMMEKSEASFEKYQSLIDYVQNLKYELISLVTGISAEQVQIAEEYSIKEDSSFLSKFTRLDNYEIPTKFLFETHKNNGGLPITTELKHRIVAYKNDMKALLGFNNSRRVNLGLNVEKMVSLTDNKDFQTWEDANFRNTSLAADVLLLNTLITEIRSAEIQVLAYLYRTVSGPDPEYNSIFAKAIAVSNHVRVGDVYEAEIFVAAYDSQYSPRIIIGAGVDTSTMTVLGNPIVIKGKAGKGIYKVRADKPGEHKFGGVVEYTTRYGTTARYPFSSSYFVEPK